MTISHSSRLFASDHANTQHATIPTQIATDSQFPFNADDIIVAIDDDRLIITAVTDEGESG